MVSEQTLAKIRQTIARYPQRRSAVIPVLHLVQEELGWLSQEAQAYVAEVLELPPIKVYEVATFYTMFNKQPVGCYHVQVCTNISCMLRDCASILSLLQDKLSIKPGETTSDQRFTLTTVECLASCGTAPVMQVNNDYVGNLTRDKLDDYLAKLS